MEKDFTGWEYSPRSIQSRVMFTASLCPLLFKDEDLFAVKKYIYLARFLTIWKNLSQYHKEIDSSKTIFVRRRYNFVEIDSLHLVWSVYFIRLNH